MASGKTQCTVLSVGTVYTQICLLNSHYALFVFFLLCLLLCIVFTGLPALVENMETIVNHLFVLLETYSSGGASGETFELCQLCFRVSLIYLIIIYFLIYFPICGPTQLFILIPLCICLL